MMETKECCGWPELGVCKDCPDPETVQWGKDNAEHLAKCAKEGYYPIAGSEEAHKNIKAIFAILDRAIDDRDL